MLKKIKNKIYYLLRWSEKWTKTDMVYLASGGFWLTAGQTISSTSSFLLAIAFANLLPKETYGIYKYVLSLVSILLIPTLSGLNTALTQAVARGYDGSLFLALKTKIKWGFLSSLASLLMAGYYFYNSNTTLAFLFLIATIFLPFMDSFTVYNAFLNGKKEFKIFTKYGIIIQVIATSMMFASLYLTNNIFILIFIYFISYTFLRFLFLKITLKKFKLNEKKDPETISYGKHLSLMNVLGTVSMQIDKILIFHYLGAAELAIYIFALAPIEQLRGLIKNIQPLAMPKFANQNNEFNYIEYLKKLFLMMVILIIIILFFISFAPFMYKIIFPKYQESIEYSKYISISLIASIAMINNSFLKSKKLKKELYKLSTIIPIIQIFLTAVGVVYLGLFGVIFAYISTKVIEAIYSTYLIIILKNSLNKNKTTSSL